IVGNRVSVHLRIEDAFLYVEYLVYEPVLSLLSANALYGHGENVSVVPTQQVPVAMVFKCQFYATLGLNRLSHAPSVVTACVTGEVYRAKTCALTYQVECVSGCEARRDLATIIRPPGFIRRFRVVEQYFRIAEHDPMVHSRLVLKEKQIIRQVLLQIVT